MFHSNTNPLLDILEDDKTRTNLLGVVGGFYNPKHFNNFLRLEKAIMRKSHGLQILLSFRAFPPVQKILEVMQK